MANRVTITDCNGEEAVAEDTALQARRGWADGDLARGLAAAHLGRG
jgi:hypothetical protein